MLALWACSASAATINVTTNADELNVDGDCSLREAVEAANTNTAVDACTAGSSNGDDFIDVVAISGQTVTLMLGEIVVTGGTWFGPANGPPVATLTIDAGGTSRIFSLNTTGGNTTVVRFQRLTMRNGLAERGGAVLVPVGNFAEFQDCTFANNQATGSTTADGGGAMYTAGTVAVLNGTFSNNAAVNGGAILNAASGSLQILVTGGTLRFLQNQATRAGGAIETAGQLRITGGTFTANRAGVDGGAVHITGSANASISSTFSQNVALGAGGALWNSASGSLSVDGGLISNNTAGGAAADQGGGGVFSDGGVTLLRNVTLTGNNATGASGSGGGVLNTASGRLTVIGGSITNNTAVRAGGGVETSAVPGTSGNLVALTNVTISGNNAGSAPGFGGGIHMTGPGVVTVSGGVVASNTAVEGGGIWVSAAGSLTVSGGTSIASNVATGAAAGQGGGGVYSDGGTVTLSGVAVRDNLATGAGGGVLVNGGTLTYTGGQVERNRARRAGGGIALDGSTSQVTAIVSGVTIRENNFDTAPGDGGGVHTVGAVAVTMTNGAVEANRAIEGGGLWIGMGSTLTMTGTLVSANQATGDSLGHGGGGLYVDRGAATVSGATFNTNSATGAAGSGGGLLNNGGVIAVRETSFTENQARRAGGAVEEVAAPTASGPASAYVRVTMTGNRAGISDGAAPGDGGAFHLTGTADVRIDSSIVSGNTAVNDGGGLWVSQGGRMIATATLVEGNAAVRGGGFFKTGSEGVAAFFRSLIASNTASVAGGGVFSDGGRAGVQISTLSDNRAPRGAGLFNSGGSVVVFDATVAGNVATTSGGGVAGVEGETVINNSLLADNVAPSGADCAGFLIATGVNLVETTEGCNLAGTITLSGVDPGLQPLADNGGATRTHALLSDSPAATAGQTTSAFDQRGYTRDIPQSIGAYEFGGVIVGEEPGPSVIAGASAFALSRAVPNPFRGVTTFQFTTAMAESVEVALFDALGRRVRTLYVGTPGAGTPVEVTVDGASLPPGVYVVRLNSGTAIATRRLTVVR